ncbi:MAG: hypothetical protein KC646_16270 [Candidatus Cloacimonetes bacterium]|nr:hypothetical protein [Candidatus Cloacimonadota bacterium]
MNCPKCQSPMEDYGSYPKYKDTDKPSPYSVVFNCDDCMYEDISTFDRNGKKISRKKYDLL